MTIIAAAIKFGDITVFRPAPARHHDVLQAMVAPLAVEEISYESAVQGFIDHTGHFHSRYSAMAHAIASGQAIRRTPGFGYHGPELYSEDLW